MNSEDPVVLNRRKILLAALMGGTGAAVAACSPEQSTVTDDIWAGYDHRITERTLAETEKVFGLKFSPTERRQILGGTIEEGDDGFFASQIETLQRLALVDPILLQCFF